MSIHKQKLYEKHYCKTKMQDRKGKEAKRKSNGRAYEFARAMQE